MPDTKHNTHSSLHHSEAGSDRKKLRKNLFKVYALGFFHGLQLIIPVFVPLLQGHGLTMGEILQTQAVFAFMIATLELPSGYLADAIGRKHVLLAGSLAASIGFFVLLGAETFLDFVLFEALMGIAVSLTSGADIALLYDTRNALGAKPQSNARAFGRLLSLSSVAECLAALLASVLLFSSVEALLLCQFILALVPVIIASQLVEPPKTVSVAESGLALKDVLAALLFERRLVLWVSIAIIAFGLTGLYAFWTHQKYWELAGIDMRYFGLIWACYCLVRAFAAHFAQQLENLLGPPRLLALLAALPLVALATMALAPPTVGIVASLLFPVMRGVGFVVLLDALNSRISGTYRATINSLISLVTRGIFIVTAPLLGFGIDNLGVQTMLLFLLLALAPMLVLVCVKLVGSIHRDVTAASEQTMQESTAVDQDDSTAETAFRKAS